MDDVLSARVTSPDNTSHSSNIYPGLGSAVIVTFVPVFPNSGVAFAVPVPLGDSETLTS